jgi:glutamine synthetase type III
LQNENSVKLGEKSDAGRKSVVV